MTNPLHTTLDTKTTRNPNGFQKWVLDHDSSIVFNILYIGLAVVLSIWLGLFWLVMVVGVHAVIEFYRQYLISSRAGYALLEALWEVKLDIGLIVFAFWLDIYLDFIFGIAGLSAGARVVAQAGGRVAQTGTRVAVWQRVIRGFFITLDDVGLALKALGKRKNKTHSKGSDENAEMPVQDNRLSWKKKYTVGDWLSLTFVGVFFLLILLAPYLTDKSITEVLIIIRDEMRPFP